MESDQRKFRPAEYNFNDTVECGQVTGSSTRKQTATILHNYRRLIIHYCQLFPLTTYPDLLHAYTK